MRSMPLLLACLTFGACPSGGVTDSKPTDTTDTDNTGGSKDNISWGECEGTPKERSAIPRTDTAWQDDGSTFVYAEQNGEVILFHLLNLTANCCPDPVSTVALTGKNLRLDFNDLGSGGGCNCICVIDFEVVADGYDTVAGGYGYEVWYHGEKIGEGNTNEVF